MKSLSFGSGPRRGAPDHWQLDQGFIDQALAKAAAASIVTLDIFDTALTRLLDSPADAFAEMELRLCAKHGADWRGFAQQREEAERDARHFAYQTGGAEEVGLDEIYAALARRLPKLAGAMYLGREIELAVERDVLVAVPDVLELTRRLGGQGIPYAFISDMYLSSKFLAQVLTESGYEGWNALYVSCETGRTKSSGRQWARIEHKLGDLSRVLHIGDDQHADVERPRHFNVNTLCYKRCRSERRVGAALTPDLLPFSRTQRAHVLATRACVDYEQRSTEEYWRDLGRVLGGLTLVAFVQWLRGRVERDDVEKLFFCARDGSLMLRAWQVAGMEKAVAAESSYLYVARRPLNLACGYLDSTEDRLSSSLLDFLTTDYGQRVTLADALKRANLGNSDAGAVDSPVVARLSAKVNDLGSIYLDEEQNLRLFKDALQAEAAFVRTVLHQDYLALVGYLDQMGMTHTGSMGLVDMGWHGSMQRSIRRIISRQGATGTLRGYYYGLWTGALRNMGGAGLMEAAFASPFSTVADNLAMVDSVAPLEELHMAPHGTVLGYRSESGRWNPVLADSPDEMQQFESITKYFQEGALAYVAEAFDGQGNLKASHADVTPAAVKAMLESIVLSPNPTELSLIASLGHCATFDHSKLEPIVPRDKSQTSVKDLLAKTAWRMGTLRQSYLNGGAERRAQAAQAASEWLGNQSRRLRQFS